MKSKTSRKRLDLLLVERGLAESIASARAMVLAGEVWVADTRAQKAGTAIAEDLSITVNSRAQKYASRGGLKLQGALEDFSIDPTRMVCLDVGSSTGGFTDCLLQHGALRVYAIDVNVDQMSWKLQKDPRVVRVKCNARNLRREDIPDLVDLVVLDVSFISATKVLLAASATAKAEADILILVKPQFELPRGEVGPGGIVSDLKLHEHAVEKVRAAAVASGLESLGARPSRLAGAEGNQEYFLHARKKLLE
jgi:23S rRNA (cytidine1920-2'-O)/16S rRNA (cytidine1409-2'-O)-methyltransferase